MVELSNFFLQLSGEFWAYFGEHTQRLWPLLSTLVSWCFDRRVIKRQLCLNLYRWASYNMSIQSQKVASAVAYGVERHMTSLLRLELFLWFGSTLPPIVHKFLYYVKLYGHCAVVVVIIFFCILLNFVFKSSIIRRVLFFLPNHTYYHSTDSFWMQTVFLLTCI